MKTYYILSKAILDANIGKCGNWHGIPADPALPDGDWIIATEFGDKGHEAAWKKLDGVTPMAHPLSGLPAGAAAAKSLAKHSVTAADTPYDIAAKLEAIHPLMGLG